MSWRERLQPASFRGVSFRVERHQAEFGRNKVTHEYPQRNESYTEDMGRKTREFSISAYLVGDDYDLQRNRLIEAIEAPGAAELVHPYLGTMRVEALKATLSEESASGRFCVLALSFVEAGIAKFPSASIDRVTVVNAAAAAVADQAEADFAKTFSIRGLPQFCIDSVSAKVQDLADQLEAMAGPLIAASESATLFRDIRSMAADVETLMQSPELLASRIRQNVMAFGGVSDSGMAAVRRVLALTGFGNDDRDVGTSTSTRRRQGRNNAAINALVQQAGLSAAASSAVVSEFETYDEAVAVRDEIIAAADVQLEEASDPAFFAIRDIQAQIALALPDAEDLPRLRQFTPVATVPSLLVAHRLYGDASRASEIVKINRIRHPGFVTGGRPLRVLSDE